MSEALQGIRILELSSVLAGPLAGSALALRGAHVTKVERPPHGDVTRTWKARPLKEEQGLSSYYASANMGKDLVWKDLASPDGQTWLEEELLHTDVVIQNFKDSDLAKFRLEPMDLAARFPDLVHVRLIGFAEAPNRLAYDVVVQAETGFMSMNGECGSQPLRMPVALMDVLASHQIRTAVLEGLFGRAQGMGGCYAEVSLEESGISALVNQATNWLMDGKIPSGQGSIHPNIAPYGDLLKCADGWMVLAVGNDRQFQALCSLFDHPEWAADGRFIDNPARLANRASLMELLTTVSFHYTRAHWDALFQSAGVPAGVVRTIDEVFASGTVGETMLVSGPENALRPSPLAYRITRY